ncbi:MULTISPECIES: redox-sensitive transcriptional activator SoxR [Alteromonadaceae]|uniref:redox-sensitive transcriptional activator SoxR n=1 Tax=Alteromonadaceae TaxID=72275 RepID=UPI001C089F99|nr:MULTISPECIES: redox-sensitive transcriptional activator SoxR [Aliiglaciecola]MBU2879521.1 redox-sensitive transcriptional activator SoxR [Aliiglaciecola lipolytica]MDO6712559.1 redox-sensitive transcriptional activator SoxR [Aliiglaciecola sp. 2_MG-2023]MDO6753697.1 redox-sensitive transcriptional activator SoxR [Aliiglaciecola sp. 1_MG-2023]
MAERELSVGFVAKRCGVKVSTLHFYEQKGLIQSWRNSGNQRRYKADVLRRVSVIKAAQKIGISLQDIKLTFATLPQSRTPTKQDWAKLSRNWQQQLEARIQSMIKLKDSLDGCIGCGCLSMKSCPIYNPQDNLAIEGPGPVLLDRQRSSDLKDNT